PRVTGAAAPPRTDAETAPNTGTTSVGPSPRPTHAAASVTMATRIATGASTAEAAASLRGRARNVIPKALTKHAIARPPVSARLAIPRMKTRLRPTAARYRFWKSTTNV